MSMGGPGGSYVWIFCSQLLELFGNIRKLEEVGHRVSLCQKPFIIPRVLSELLFWQHYLPACRHQVLRYDGVMVNPHPLEATTSQEFFLLKVGLIMQLIHQITALRTNRRLKRDTNYVIRQYLKGTEVWCKSRIIGPSSTGSLPFTKISYSIRVHYTWHKSFVWVSGLSHSI